MWEHENGILYYVWQIQFWLQVIIITSITGELKKGMSILENAIICAFLKHLIITVKIRYRLNYLISDEEL